MRVQPGIDTLARFRRRTFFCYSKISDKKQPESNQPNFFFTESGLWMPLPNSPYFLINILKELFSCFFFFFENRTFLMWI
jgi:hypothetical protein